MFMFISHVIGLATLVGLGLARLGPLVRLLVRLGLGLAGLLGAASAVLSCFHLKSSATGWKVGVCLEVAGT